MNTQELIESGKLELFVAGTLCGKERDQVAAMVKADPLLQSEVQAIEETMLASLNEGTFEPRKEVKNKIMAAIQTQPKGISRKLEMTSTTAQNEKEVININPVNRWLIAASVALLLGFGATYYSFNQKINAQQNQLAALNEKYTLQVVANENSKNFFSKFSEQLALINHQNTKKIILNGVAANPNARAVVYWNTLNGKVIINPSALPTPPSDKQYQLWALLDGKPIDAGVFDITTDSINLQNGKNIGNAQAFAVTLEQKGGVSSPTLSAMFVMATI